MTFYLPFTLSVGANRYITRPVYFLLFSFCIFSISPHAFSKDSPSTNSNIEKTDSTFNSATVNSSKTDTTLLIDGKLAFEKGDYTKAFSALIAATKQVPNNSEALRFLGMTEYKRQNYNSAITSLEKSLTFSPNDPETHYALGVSYLGRTSEVNVLKVRKMIKKSIRHLEETIRLNPNHIRAHFYLIQILINAPGIMGGDTEKGLELNKQLAIIAPLQHLVVNSSLAIKDDNLKEAETLLLNANEKYPNKPMIAYSLGELYIQLEQPQKAIDYGTQFLAGEKAWDDSGDVSGYYLLARAHKGLNQTEKSRQYYSRVLQETNNKRFKKQINRELDELDGKTIEPNKDELADQELSDALSKEDQKD